jgi:hypothetical protein
MSTSLLCCRPLAWPVASCRPGLYSCPQAEVEALVPANIFTPLQLPPLPDPYPQPASPDGLLHCRSASRLARLWRDFEITINFGWGDGSGCPLVCPVGSSRAAARSPFFLSTAPPNEAVKPVRVAHREGGWS